MIIENVDKAIRQINNFHSQILKQVNEKIDLVGNKIVEDLNMQFPDLSFTGQFFSNNMEYWITVTGLGKEMTWIWCEKWHTYFRRTKDIDGSQEITSNQKEIDIDFLANEIADELSLQLNVVGRKV